MFQTFTYSFYFQTILLKSFIFTCKQQLQLSLNHCRKVEMDAKKIDNQNKRVSGLSRAKEKCQGVKSQSQQSCKTNQNLQRYEPSPDYLNIQEPKKHSILSKHSSQSFQPSPTKASISKNKSSAQSDDYTFKSQILDLLKNMQLGNENSIQLFQKRTFSKNKALEIQEKIIEKLRIYNQHHQNNLAYVEKFVKRMAVKQPFIQTILVDQTPHREWNLLIQYSNCWKLILSLFEFNSLNETFFNFLDPEAQKIIKQIERLKNAQTKQEENSRSIEILKKRQTQVQTEKQLQWLKEQLKKQKKQYETVVKMKDKMKQQMTNFQISYDREMTSLKLQNEQQMNRIKQLENKIIIATMSQRTKKNQEERLNKNRRQNKYLEDTLKEMTQRKSKKQKELTDIQSKINEYYEFKERKQNEKKQIESSIENDRKILVDISRKKEALQRKNQELAYSVAVRTSLVDDHAILSQKVQALQKQLLEVASKNSSCLQKIDSLLKQISSYKLELEMKNNEKKQLANAYTKEIDRKNMQIQEIKMHLDKERKSWNSLIEEQIKKLEQTHKAEFNILLSNKGKQNNQIRQSLEYQCNQLKRQNAKLQKQIDLELKPKLQELAKQLNQESQSITRKQQQFDECKKNQWIKNQDLQKKIDEFASIQHSYQKQNKLLQSQLSQLKNSKRQQEQIMLKYIKIANQSQKNLKQYKQASQFASNQLYQQNNELRHSIQQIKQENSSLLGQIKKAIEEKENYMMTYQKKKRQKVLSINQGVKYHYFNQKNKNQNFRDQSAQFVDQIAQFKAVLEAKQKKIQEYVSKEKQSMQAWIKLLQKTESAEKNVKNLTFQLQRCQQTLRELKLAKQQQVAALLKNYQENLNTIQILTKQLRIAQKNNEHFPTIINELTKSKVELISQVSYQKYQNQKKQKQLRQMQKLKQNFSRQEKQLSQSQQFLGQTLKNIQELKRQAMLLQDQNKSLKKNNQSLDNELSSLQKNNKQLTQLVQKLQFSLKQVKKIQKNSLGKQEDDDNFSPTKSIDSNNDIKSQLQILNKKLTEKNCEIQVVYLEMQKLLKEKQRIQAEKVKESQKAQSLVDKLSQKEQIIKKMENYVQLDKNNLQEKIKHIEYLQQQLNKQQQKNKHSLNEIQSKNSRSNNDFIVIKDLQQKNLSLQRQLEKEIQEKDKNLKIYEESQKEKTALIKMKKESEQIQLQISKLRSDNSSLHQRITELNANCQTKERQIQSLTLKVKQFEMSMSEFQSTKQKLNKQLKQKEKLIFSALVKIREQELEYEQLVGHKKLAEKALGKKQENLKEQKRDFDGRIIDKDKQIEVLKKEIKSKEEIYQIHLRNKDEMNKIFDRERKQKEKCQEQIQALRRQKVELENKINSRPKYPSNTNSEEVRTLKLSLAKLNNQLQQSKKAAKQQTEERDRLYSELREINKKYDELNRKQTSPKESRMEAREEKAPTNPLSDLQLVKHLFHGEALMNMDEQRLFLKKSIEDHKHFTIVDTKLIHRFDPLNAVNIHRYVDGKEQIVVVVRLVNGYCLAGYSEGSFTPKTASTKSGMLISLTNKKCYYLNEPNKKAIVYDDFFLIFGNSEIRIKTQEKKMFSNFGLSVSFYKHNGDSVTQFLGGDKSQREMEFESCEIYQLILK